MSAQPFQTPTAELMPAGQAAPAVRQPVAFMLVQLITALAVFVATTSWLWLRTDIAFQDMVVRALPRMVGTFLGGLVFVLALTLLLAHQQRERYRIACFRPMVGLLIVFALLSVVLGQVWRVAGSALGGYVFPMLQALGDYRLWAALYSLLYSLVGALSCGLALWGGLRFARGRSAHLAADQASPVPAWQVACAIALWVFALYLKVAGTVLLGLPAIYVQPVDWLTLFFSGAPAFVIVWTAIQTRLPPQVARFSAGKVLLTAMAIVLLWCLAGLLGMMLTTLVLYRDGTEPPSDALVLLLLLAWQVSAWPLARWCLRWCYIGNRARA